MTESFRSQPARCPPLRQVRGTVLNTIMEDTREALYARKPDNTMGNSHAASTFPQLKLKTINLPSSSRLNRFASPLSAGTTSSCSDTEWQRQMSGFDDLYDATDEETELSDDCMSFTSTRPTSLTTPTTRNSMNSTPRNRYPSLTIPPSSMWPSANGQHKSSPIPPTPPPKIPVSPAALSMLCRSVPAPHAPPSLDGSVSSDQVSNTSAPQTPDLQSLPDNDWCEQEIRVRLDESQSAEIPDADANVEPQSIEVPEDTEADWHSVLMNFPQIPTASRDETDPELVREQTPSDRGIVLPEDAMTMLQHIPLDGAPDPWSETSEENEEMWQLEAQLNRPRSADNTPLSDTSGYSFSQLSIPSPGGFFASLGPRARHTWSVPTLSKIPSSATAANFYNLPWRRSEGEVVEHVIDCPERCGDDQSTARYDENGPPTAIRISNEEESRRVEHVGSPTSGNDGDVDEIPRSAASHEYDNNYEDELRKRADESHDRTSVWLDAQTAYLSVFRETNPINAIEKEPTQDDVEKDSTRVSTESTRKKCVRFSEAIPEALSPPPPASASRDSIYWRGFQSVRQQSCNRDSFLHRDMRFDAVQSFRLGLTDIHAARLLGDYELVRHERPPYKGPFKQAPRNSVVASVLTEKAKFSKVEKEQLVLSQLRQPIWAIDALKYFNGGHLLTNPLSRKRCRAACRSADAQTTKTGRVRVLDLGGHASCEWAWYLAHDYPNVKFYTAYTKEQPVNQGIKGPANHRRVAVSHLWQLPFPDNRFDVISARSLHAFLKTEFPAGENRDEYDLCLKECYRCLKPGGYLEFFVMDAQISHAGPFASATSVEFAFSLKTRGYDPTPTKNFICRLQKGNFVGLKRAWVFLPMGNEPSKTGTLRETPDPRVKSQVDAYEAVHGPVGSTADVANVTGLLGGWIWEQWLLKLQIETGRERGKLLEGIGTVFDEGRKNGAGWTCLSGWAMKPKRRKPLALS